MKRLFAVALLLMVAAISLLWSCKRPPKINLALTHVTLIDATGSPAQPDMTIVIVNQRIAAIGPSTSTAIPPDAEIFDATGKFLIPGLTDAHIHLTAADEPSGSREFILPLLLANGITTVRDMGGYLDSIRPLQKDIADGKRLGPRIFTPGPYLDGNPPSFQPSIVVASSAQGSKEVHALIQKHVDFIKVQSILSRNAYFAIAAAANREHIPFVGHVPDRVTAAEAADAGQHSIEHLTNVLRACSRDEPKLMREQFFITTRKQSAGQSRARESRWMNRLLSDYSEEKAAALIAKFKEKDVWQTPTLILLKNNAFPTLENTAVSDDRAKYIPSGTLNNWKKSHAEQMKTLSPQDSELHARLLQKSLDLVSQMQKAGVKILAGTDSPAPYVFPGSSLHDELQLLVQAGLTPLEALQSATKNPAEFLHVEKVSGTIEKGKYADLVLLDANPLENIRNSRKIRAVILRGKLCHCAALDGLLEAEQTFAATH